MDLQLVPCERHFNDLDYGSGYQTEQVKGLHSVRIFIRAQQKVPECSADKRRL